ncbi:MAG: TonB-dependent receptor [Sphingomonadaceae bacterium]
MTNSAARLRSALAHSASATALATILTISPAVAQSAPDAASDEDVIVVTGFRASLDASAKIKRNSAAILESVSAEDIGKLPDVSIADSLARLPGVTAQRLEGRDQRLSIRGLGPDFSTTLLNGREQVTVGDNRGVEYDQYPSEFFQNVVVYKAADPSVVAAGIAGTVDLRMLRPLTSTATTLAVQVRGQMNGTKNLNPDSPRFGYRASATYIDQFADDTLGIAIGVSATSAPSQNERYNAWGFPNDGDAGPAVGNALRLGGAKPYVQSNLLTRYGAVATVEYRPSDNWHTTLDVLYSNFRETQRLRGIEFPINPGWGAGTTITNPTIANNFVTAATINGVRAVQRNDINKRTADNFSIGLNNRIGLGETTNLTIDASWSRATRTDFLLETYTGPGYNQTGPTDTLRITQNADGTFRIVPTFDYTNTGPGGVGITDPRGWGFNGTTTVVQAGFLNQPKFKDDLKSLRASLDGEFEGGNFFKGWEIGANYSRRQKTSAYTSFFLCPRGGNPDCTVRADLVGTFVPVPEAARVGTVSLDYLGVPAMLALDPIYLYNNTLLASFDNRPGSLVRDNVITENVLTGYAMLKIDGEAGGKPVRGAIGVQVVNTRQKSTGTLSAFNVVNGVPQVTIAPASGGANYTNINPSAQLSVEFLTNTFVKLSASHTMVRARLDRERVNQEVNIDFTRLGNTDPGNSGFSSNGGNPALRPYQSTNIDVSLEHYFQKGGYVSVAGYFKDLTDFVDNNNSVIGDFSALATALQAAVPGVVIGTTQGRVSQPGNTGEGFLLGGEATLSLPFAVLSDSLDGFGFFGSGSYVFSEIKLGNNPNPIPLPGQSDWILNASLYFEKDGFQARGSYRYRSKFLGEIAGLSANPDFRQASAEVIVDAQIGYEFQRGFLKGLAITAQGKNLTDRPFVTSANGDPRQVIDYQRYGREYYLGVSYKF